MKLNIVIALSVEAKPIIRVLKLKKDISEHVFEIYHNHDKTLCLVISGTGKINAAAATSYIALYHKTKHQGFLNIGSAGGRFEIGDWFVADKLCQPSINRTYYPKINFLKNAVSKHLETHDVPTHNYSTDTMVDMESYGFYQTAVKFTSQEFIHVVKIISDNSSESLKEITVDSLCALIEKNIEALLDLIQQSLELLQKENFLLNKTDYFEKKMQPFYFSQQQKQQLDRLIQRASVFFDTEKIDTIIKNSRSGRALLQEFHNQLLSCY